MFDVQDLHSPSALTAVDPPAASTSTSGHPLDRLSALYRHRRAATAAFLIVVAAALVQTYSKIPLYRTSARVLIQDERTVAVGKLNANDPQFWEESDQYYNTQYSILKSRGLARRVVERLHLRAHPLFDGTAPQGRGPQKLMRDVRRLIGSAVSGVTARATAPRTEPRSVSEDAADSGAINQFLSGLAIAPEKSTRLVEIVYTSSDAQFAALAANTLAEEYAQQNLDLRLDTLRRNLAWLDTELVKQETKVREAEAAMASYREQQNALSLEDRQNIVVSRLNQLNDTVTRARTTRLQKESLFDQIKRVNPASDEADAFPIISANPGVVEAKNRLTELNAQKAQLTGRYLSSHPEMVKLDMQIENARTALVTQRARVIESMRNEYLAASNEERSFAGQLEFQKGAAMDLDKKSGAYLVLQREAESDRLVYQSLLQQEKELRVISNSRTNNVQVMDRAEVPGGPFSPNIRRDSLMALLAGLVVAFGLAFGIEYFDDTVKTPEDVARELKLPLLGLVPAVRGPRVPLLSGPVPHDFGEAFRSLRTSLAFTSASYGTRIVAVTSTQPLEGKTTTACNVATALALGGARVLLIDADMRRPNLHRVLSVENRIGLSHILVGQARVRDAVQQTTEPNLFVIAAGQLPPNPSELLGSERMRTFLTNLQSGPFEWVVIDTPPVLAVTDAVLVARAASSVVFVVGSEMTRRVHAERAIETLMTGRPPSVGVVLNRVDLERNRYYYTRYYGYHYQSYYGHGAATPL